MKYLEESRDEEHVWCRKETGTIDVPAIADVTILMLRRGFSDGELKEESSPAKVEACW